jgi:hypothetical protein
MYADLVRHSPLLFLAIVALVMFFGVWLATLAHTVTRKRLEVEALARLPLHDEEESHGR